jgi:hypothetical protein
MSSPRTRKLLNSPYFLLLLALPLVLCLVWGGNGFAYPSQEALYSDLTLTHYPNTLFLSSQLLKSHNLPLWSPTILSGYPFIANPLNGIWYPFGWPALFLPLPLAFNLLIGLHLNWGALGLYLLLRRQQISHLPAIFGGLAFGLLPKLFAHYGAGHLTLLYAVPWTPWLLLATPLDRLRRRGFTNLLPGVVLALTFMADVRWAAYAGLLWVGWILFAPQAAYRAQPGPSGANRPAVGWRLLVLGGNILLALILVAVLALPMLEYTRLSTRALLEAQDVFTFSLSPAGLLGLFFPPLEGGLHESTLYLGAIVTLSALASLARLRADSRVAFWGAVALAAMVYALGSNLPGLSLLAQLPVFNLLRVPTRALFIGGLALICLASITIDRLWKSTAVPVSRRMNLGLFVLSLSLALIGLGAALLVTGRSQISFLWGGLALAITYLWLAGALNKKINPGLFLCGAFVLLVADMLPVNLQLVNFHSRQQVLSEGAAAANYLASQPSHFRVYSPCFDPPQQVTYDYGLQTAQGVDPLQLASYADYLQAASGIPSAGYSVTLPSFVECTPGLAPYLPDPQALGLLNVKYITANYDFPEMAGLSKIAQFGDTRVYANPAALPRAWVLPPGASQNAEVTAAELDTYTPNRLVLTAEGPGQLVLSEIDYPGWEAWVDTQPVTIVTYAGLMRSVSLPNGTHQVEFRFRPRTFYLGLILSTAGLLALLGTALIELRHWAANRR